jgi:hypothetical protein
VSSYLDPYGEFVYVSTTRSFAGLPPTRPAAIRTWLLPFRSSAGDPASGFRTTRHGAIASLAVMLSLAGCAGASPPTIELISIPEPAPIAVDTVTTAPEARVREFARELLEQSGRFRVPELGRRSLNHRRLWETLEPILESAPDLHREEIGRSGQQRPIYSVSFGQGPVRVLLWSQMHGDEPTATLALADLLRYLSENRNSPLVSRLRERLTVISIPMLNPDGAERSSRENASGIDVNRDARRQQSPEARALASVHARWSPHFGFNLHDQDLRVGERGRVVAISLLAPPQDYRSPDNETRARAKRIAALMRVAADSLVEGRVTRYDEDYNPNAFGDAMQSWGTSTVLIETGAWKNDTEKDYLREVNFALLVTALDAIATGAYARADLDAYESLAESRVPSDRR